MVETLHDVMRFQHVNRLEGGECTLINQHSDMGFSLHLLRHIHILEGAVKSARVVGVVRGAGGEEPVIAYYSIVNCAQ